MAEGAGNLVGLLVLHLRDDHLLLDSIAAAAQRSGVGRRLLDLTRAWPAGGDHLLAAGSQRRHVSENLVAPGHPSQGSSHGDRSGSPRVRS